MILQEENHHKISAAPGHEDAQLELQEQDMELINKTTEVSELESHEARNLEIDTEEQNGYLSRRRKEPSTRAL